MTTRAEACSHLAGPSTHAASKKRLCDRLSAFNFPCMSKRGREELPGESRLAPCSSAHAASPPLNHAHAVQGWGGSAALFASLPCMSTAASAALSFGAQSRTSLSPFPPPAPPPLPPNPPRPPSLEFFDCFLGRRMRCQLLFAQPAEIDAPLHVIAAAAARLHLLLSHPLRALLPPPSGYMRVSLWPAQLQRAAFGCVVAASRRLTSAPSSCARCKQRSRALILRRVLGGYVAMVKVTVRAARCDCGSAACAHLFAMFVLTRAAANACSMQGSKPRLSSSRLQGDTPPSSFSFGTALQSVLASACSPPPRVQAAAAARIAGKVIAGEVRLQHKGYGLVSDLLIADAAFVHQRDSSCVARSFFCSPYAVDNIRYIPASF